MLYHCVFTGHVVLLIELHGTEHKNSYVSTLSNPNL
jgi:hypothetical protein